MTIAQNTNEMETICRLIYLKRVICQQRSFYTILLYVKNNTSFRTAAFHDILAFSIIKVASEGRIYK